MTFRDRIVGIRRVPAGELVPHAKNWRKHPKAQRAALRGALEEIGYAQALLARKLPDGKLALIDGHLRAELDPLQKIPVLVLDVTEAEADKLLATLDPLAAMAKADGDRLASLLRGIQTGSDALASMLEGMMVKSGQLPPGGNDDPLADPAPTEPDVACRATNCYITVYCTDEAHQFELLERFQAEGLTCRPSEE